MRWVTNVLPHAAGCLIFAIVFGTLNHIADVHDERYTGKLRADTLQKLSAIRANAESAINKRVYLTLGLRAHVSCNPDLTEDEFADLASALVNEGNGIRSITLIKDNVINDVYPRQGNEKALGLSLLEHPTQRAAALKAIDSGKPWLDGPIRLVQGGEAFINRAPVYETPPGGPPASGRYWGMVSIVFGKDEFVGEIMRDLPSDLSYGIFANDQSSDTSTLICGNGISSGEDEIALDVSLPTYSWKLIGKQKSGFASQSLFTANNKFLSLAVAGFFGFAIFLLISFNKEYREARQAALVASEAKSEFLANMSHEIRTPLTAILGYADVMEDTSEVNANAINTIRRHGEHLLRVINDILDLSKLDSQKIELESIEFSLPNLLRDMHDMMQIRASEHSLDWTIEIEGSLPESVRSDPTRIRQVLLNLLGNAFKFTKSGGVRLTVRWIANSEQYTELAFEIADTGIGMTEEQIGKLFQPFAQADTSTTRRFGGTGLGLVISRRLVQLLGGDIEIASEPGCGSVFSFRVKAQVPSETEFLTGLEQVSASEQKCQQVSSSLPLGTRVLLVEDGPDNQRLISFVLGKAGAEVTTAENGKEGMESAISALNAGVPFAVVLMDMQMPIMDGYSAARALRDQDYRGPIIALTAHAMAEDRQKCLDAGCDAYTTKPIDREHLIGLIAEYANQELSCAGA